MVLWWVLIAYCCLCSTPPLSSTFSVSYLDWDSVSAEDDGPEHVTAILGQSVVLNCAIEFPEGVAIPYIIQWQKLGVKIPIYIWYDGYPPHRGEGYEGRISLANQASLNISDVRESDQGWYECKVFFLNRPPDPGKNGTWIHLDVHAPPHFTVTPQEVIYVKIGDSIFLNCEAEGTPKPNIIWYKDEKPLEPSSNIQIYSSGHEVKVTSLRQVDIGDYTCMAQNPEGKVSHTTKVIIAGGAVITEPPHNITMLEGEKAEFICEAKALPGNITHRWYRNDVEIKEFPWLETRTIVRRGGTLVINPLSADDLGKYTCEVSNGIGTPQTASAYLNVEYPARVTYTPTVQYLPSGLSGIVQCHFEANPAHQFITWIKDGRVLEPNTTPGVSTLNNGSLHIHKVSQEHQGRYTCTPYNTHGTSGMSGIMEVLVRDPPIITQRPLEMYQKTINSEVKMPCEAQGHPKPEITWRRADGAKMSRERAQIRGGNLTIRALRKEDHGYYECVIQNEIATLVVSTLLLIESTTPHAPTNVSVNTSVFEATVSWLPAYDGGYSQHYVVWYRESDRGDNAWRTLRVTPDSANSFTIYNLSPNTNYDFQVLSRNDLGDGMFSPIATAKTNDVDYTVPVLPTDATGSTYFPTIHHPSGPVPGAPRNVMAREEREGVVISWLPPSNTSVPVVYYIVEYKTEHDPNWMPTGEKIVTGFTHTMKNLIPGKKYAFRVKSSTTTMNSHPSEEIPFTLTPPSQQKAITAGIVGGILFFIVAIILSVCAVKICNKRKQRKQEKDARNGGHGPVGSPVPLKKRPEGRVSSVSLGSLKQKLKQVIPLALVFKPSLEEASQRYGDSQEWGRHPRPLATELIGRRFPKAVRYSVQMEYSQPLGWITRTPEGKFVVEEGFSHPEPMHSNRASLQGSYRSEGSGQSGLGSMLDLSLRNRSRSWWLGHDRSRPTSYWSDYRPQIQTIYEPRSPRYRVRTSSPGPIAHLRPPLQIEDVSSVHQPSSVERSFPSTVSSRFTPSGSGIHSPSYELPSLRILHEQLPYIQEEYEPYEHYVRPRPVSQQVSAEIHHDPSVGHFQSPPRPMPVSQGYMHYPLQQHQKHYIMPIQEMGVLENGQHIHTSPMVHSPEDYGARYYQPSGVFLRHRPRVAPSPRRQLDGYEVGGSVQPSLMGMGHQRPLATSSPPQTDRRVARVLPSAAGYTKQQGSESSSDDRPVTYTRDRLQEAIGRVRSGALRVERPFRHSAPELVRGPVAYSPATTSTTEEEQVPVSLATEPTLTAPNCRTSVTSASSGRGSKHSRGDSLQGDLEYSPSSSSGFASRNTSQSQPSPHAVGVPAPAARPVARHPTPPHHDMAHLRTQLDISVDENYEFDSINPLETDLLNKMHQHTPPWVSDRGMSDSELYTNFYPRPKKTSKYDDIEIERRIPALKEEFHQFRRRQQERRRSEELESEC